MDLTEVYLKIYIKTYNRFGPYVIGLGLGYILHKTRACKVKLSVVSDIYTIIFSTLILLIFILIFDINIIIVSKFKN